MEDEELRQIFEDALKKITMYYIPKDEKITFSEVDADTIRMLSRFN